MEIADIFVVNKADLPGADRVRLELEAGVPIFMTGAIDGAGIGPLVDHLQSRGRRARPPDAPEWEIDHIAIAVPSLDKALPFFEAQLGIELLSRESVDHEGVDTAMLRAGSSRIELIEPLNSESPIARFLVKRGPGLHHVALRVPDLEDLVRRLESTGIRTLGSPQRGAGGHLYVFIHPESAGGVLWELIQA